MPKEKIKSVVAKENDGTIQITFTVPLSLLSEAKERAVEALSRQVEVPGFRKGKAPFEKAREKISDTDILEKALQTLLPEAFAEAIDKHGLKPAIYPRFEVINAKEGSDWQIRAVTCELPTVNVSGYQERVAGSLRAETIWTPEKGKKETGDQTLSAEQKEQIVITTLLDSYKTVIPKVLVDEEVNRRLASLLSSIERLGLSLENYLASLGKTAEKLREEYEKQAADLLTLDLILQKIAEEQNLKITEKELEETLKVTNQAQGLKETNTKTTEAQKRQVETILLKRKVIEGLINLG